MTFRPRVTAVEPEHLLEWFGTLGMQGLFDGRHAFVLKPTAGGTTLTQTETFSWLLVPLEHEQCPAQPGWLMALGVNTASGAGIIACLECRKAHPERGAQCPLIHCGVGHAAKLQKKEHRRLLIGRCRANHLINHHKW
jgi:hypothetical protein